MTSTAPTLTLQDIADLARVRRPVVSMWRSRPTVRGQMLPFPGPVEVVGGVERFSRDDIVDWLERTGRGNNQEARLDAPALSAPDGMPLEDIVTLLCLRVTTGQELAGTTAKERRDLASRIDPRDEFLLSETAAQDARPDALRFVDELVEASYGPAEALARLENGPLGRAIGARALTGDAVDLLRTIAKACELHLNPEGVPLVYTGGSPGLTMSVATDLPHLVVPENGAESRALRRRAAIRDLEVRADVAGPSIRMLSAVGHERDQALDELDEVVVQLDEADIAIMIGAASIMCDDLRGLDEQKRAQTLRSGRLAMAIRLPRGLWREAHRQALGIWICVGGTSITRPLVADLAAIDRPELDLGDLAADVEGALGAGGARAFRYARPHDLQLILSTRTVVPRGVRAVRLGTTDPAPHLERIHTATLVTAEAVPSFDVLAAPAPGSIILRRRSLGELSELQQVRVRRGNRVDAVHADAGGTVAVLSADTSAAGFKLDPIEAVRLYPRAARTEPGDLVFVERPRPMARVDLNGGSLVASPSRILRLDRAVGIGPHAVAAIINQLPDEAHEWQAWNIPILDAAEADLLEAALIAAADYAAGLRRRLSAALDLTKALIDGVAAGAVTLRTEEMEGT